MVCKICGIGEVGADHFCDFCQQRVPREIIKLDLDILVEKILNDSVRKKLSFLENLFIPTFLANELSKPEIWTEFRKKLPEKVAHRIHLENVYEIYSKEQPCSYRLYFHL